jgi:hypothetical protein
MSTKAGPKIETYRYRLQATGNDANGIIVSWRDADGSLFEQELSYFDPGKGAGVGTAIVILCARYGTFQYRFKGDIQGALLLASGEDIPVPIRAAEGQDVQYAQLSGFSLINDGPC